MRRPARGRSGFTLIELLVAITMTSLLSLAGLYAMRVGFNALDKTGKQLSYERRVMGAQRVLEQMIVNMVPARAICHGGTVDVMTQATIQGGPGVGMPFFDGRRDAMRFVSAFSLEEAARGALRILEFAVTPGRQNEGVRLMVNEHLYWGPLSTGYFCGTAGFTPGAFMSPFLPVQTGAKSYILADRMSAVRFYYRMSSPAAPYYVWLEEWPSTIPPEAIRVEAIPLSESDGRPVTINAPIHMRRDYGGQTKYEDAFPRP